MGRKLHRDRRGRVTDPDGPRLKVRTSGPWLTAEVWSEQEALFELGRIRIDAFDRPGCLQHDAWLDAMMAVFSRMIERAIGDGVAVSALRRAPDYRGEEST